MKTLLFLLSLCLPLLSYGAAGGGGYQYLPGNNMTATTNGSQITFNSSGGTASAGGSSGALQFNQGGALAGTNTALYDRTNNLLKLVTSAGVGNVAIGELGQSTGGIGTYNNFPFGLFVNSTLKWQVYSTDGTLGPVASNTTALGTSTWPVSTVYSVNGAFFGNVGMLSATVTNNIGYKVAALLGVGPANTNFTLLATNAPSIIYIDAGTTNVNVVALMNYGSAIAYRGSVILTNRTATARLFSLGALTNNWISLQEFDGISAPFTVTNSQAARLEWECFGTNVQYSYKPMALPSN